MWLENVWFFLWGLLWAVYFLTDGFDLGVGVLLPFLGKDDAQRRVMYHSIGPLWNGNEVWLLTAGGVTFAAFPRLYAFMFSSLYAPLMLILFALIVRGVSFEFRDKLGGAAWRRLWDGCLFVGSLLPAILFGVAFANIFRGLPFDQTGYFGTLFSLLNPYGLCGGILFLLLFVVHGALWLAVKTDGDLQQRAAAAAGALWYALLGVAVLFLLATWFDTRLYANYLAHPALFLCPLVAVAALLGAKLCLARKLYWRAWASSGLTILGVTFFGVIGLFPNMFPSRTVPDANLTAHNAASTPGTLLIMLVVAGTFVPIVIAYQTWAYHLFRGKTTASTLDLEDAY
ncbi:MAG: cytochrome d ubiquinol oxidase subunit II [Lentisphaerae bacterium RIFOXYB12_FULL_65_16]|nr:MAG: cytochrome d ubiquinol oxidase subunit II [Lentisphaerae bacterium RIFOXYA12_64_32]OGV88298.1 MAG: cytochrome d ubiquinol oxidase subunit II [Lentisphaerae bacterium RIFOXYB12_FULL_65_16]